MAPDSLNNHYLWLLDKYNEWQRMAGNNRLQLMTNNRDKYLAIDGSQLQLMAPQRAADAIVNNYDHGPIVCRN